MSKIELEDYKTSCCNANWYRKGRADYRCEKCDNKVTIDLILLYQELEDEN